MAMIIILVLALQKKMKEVVAEKPKISMTSHALYGLADIGILYLMGLIYVHNGYPEMMTVSMWLMGLAASGLLIGFWVNSWKHKAS